MKRQVIHRGRNSEITRENGVVVKRLLRETPSNALAYYERLRDSGLRVAPTRIHNGSSDSIVQDFVGEKTLKDLLKGEHPVDSFQSVSRQIDFFIANRSDVRVGLSPKPSNFVFDGNNPVYVDLAPAYHNGSSQDFFHSTPLGIRLYFASHVVGLRPSLLPKVLKWLVGRH